MTRPGSVGSSSVHRAAAVGAGASCAARDGDAGGAAVHAASSATTSAPAALLRARRSPFVMVVSNAIISVLMPRLRRARAWPTLRTGPSPGGTTNEDRASRGTALRRRLAAVDVRPHRDRRRAGRLGRVQRQPEPVRHRRLRARPGRPADRPGPAAGRAALLGHAAARAAELRRRLPQGHGGHRAGAVGHQGQGARRARLRAVRRPAARPHAALLVALRDDAGAHGHDARHAGAEDLRRHRRAGPRGRGPRLHRAQDQHGHPRRSRHRLLPRLRQRHQHDRRRADRSRSWTPSTG